MMGGIVSGGFRIALGIVISKAIIFCFRKLLPAIMGLTSFLWAQGYDVKAIPAWIMEKARLAVAYTNYYAEVYYLRAKGSIADFNMKLENAIGFLPVEVFWGLVALAAVLIIKAFFVPKRRKVESRRSYEEAATPSPRAKRSTEDDILDSFI